MGRKHSESLHFLLLQVSLITIEMCTYFNGNKLVYFNKTTHFAVKASPIHLATFYLFEQQDSTTNCLYPNHLFVATVNAKVLATFRASLLNFFTYFINGWGWCSKPCVFGTAMFTGCVCVIQFRWWIANFVNRTGKLNQGNSKWLELHAGNFYSSSLGAFNNFHFELQVTSSQWM